MAVRLEVSDCREMMKALAAEGIQLDSVVTDPPYHLTSIVKRFAKTGGADRPESRVGAYTRHARGFMGRTWDGGDIAFQPETWRLCFDLMKPGAYIVAFGGSRTFGRMSVAIEDAGFINQPLIGWTYAQGFPKAHKVNAPGWEGWRYGGQAMKPALEPIYLGQKPMEGTGTENVLKYGVGALNIDGCRVEGGERPLRDARNFRNLSSNGIYGDGLNGSRAIGETTEGRWPANLITDGSDEVLAEFPQSDGQLYRVGPEHGARNTVNVYGDYGARPSTSPRGDIGSAGRFFYAAKADPDDRWGSRHPTVKPIDLMRYLARLVTPPSGLVLDPFAGSGTTGVACLAEGFKCILIERELEYANDIRARLAHYSGAGAHSLSARGRNAKAKAGAAGTPLFGDDE